MKNIYRGLFLFILVVCPLIFFTTVTRNPYLIQGVILEITGALLVLLWIFNSIRKKTMQIPSLFINRPLAIFTAVCIISFICSFYFYPQYKGSIFHFGINKLIFWLINCLLMLYLSTVLGRDKDFREKIFYTIFAVSTLASIYGIFQYCGIEIFWEEGFGPFGGRSVSTFGNPNFLASFLILSLFPMIGYFLNSAGAKKTIFFILILINFLQLLITLTRSAWGGFFVALLFIFIYLIIRERKVILKNLKWLCFLLVGAIICMIVFPYFSFQPDAPGLKERVLEITQEKEDSQAVTQRFLIWRSSLDMVEDHPLIGVGWGIFEVVYPFYQGKFVSNPLFSNWRTHANNAHNEILEIFSQTGIIGLGIYLWLWITFFIGAFKILNKQNNVEDKILICCLIGSIFAMFVDNLFNVTLHFVTPAMLFWVNIGIILSYAYQRDFKISLKGASGYVYGILTTLCCVGIIFFNIQTFRGEVHYFNGFKLKGVNPQLAIKEMEISKKIYPFNVENNYELGNLYALNGQLEKAALAYKDALRAHPGYDEIYYNLGLIYTNLGKPEEALINLKEAEKINPLSGEIKRAIGNIYINFYQDWENAQQYYEKAQEINSEDLRNLLYLGNIYFFQNEFAKAEECYLKFLEKDPHNLSALNNLGITYLRQGKNSLAQQQFKKVLKIDPDNEIALQYRGGD